MKHWMMGTLNLYLKHYKLIDEAGKHNHYNSWLSTDKKLRLPFVFGVPDSLVCIADKQVSFICSIMLNWKSFKLIKNWRVLAYNYVVIALNKHWLSIIIRKIFISYVSCISHAVLQKLTESLSWIFIPVPFQSKTLQSSALLKPAVIGFITN